MTHRGPLWGTLACPSNLQEANANEAQDRGDDEPWSGVLGVLPKCERLAHEGGAGGHGPDGQARHGGQPR